MIKNIVCYKNELEFRFGGESRDKAVISAYTAAAGEKRLIGEKEIGIKDGTARIGRYGFGCDGLFLRYYDGDGGVCFASRVFGGYGDAYPDPGTKKGLQIVDVEDAKLLGVKHAALNIAITDVMRSENAENTERFEYDGHTYYINADNIRSMDERVKGLTDAGVVVTFILLCGKHWATDVPEDMKKILLHPDYNDEGTLSAFNVVTEEGLRHYQAFCSYLAQRYYRPDNKYGRAVGMIISNEVTAQWIWGNAGEKTCAEFSEEYTLAMRIAYYAAASVYENFRIYASLDHFWGITMDARFPKRYYSGLDLLSEIAKRAKAEGDFYYNIAHHPYPQDLTKPDFWNDDMATDDYETPLVTFKNLHVLADFLYREENLFEGVRRRVILSEQGFNSKWTPESEILQAAAYGRAYHEVMKIPEIDSFILHAHHDNKEEFGLNLGLWRRKPDSQEMDRPKPAYYLFKVIDQKDDTGKFVWERF